MAPLAWDQQDVSHRAEEEALRNWGTGEVLQCREQVDYLAWALALMGQLSIFKAYFIFCSFLPLWFFCILCGKVKNSIYYHGSTDHFYLANIVFSVPEGSNMHLFARV